MADWSDMHPGWKVLLWDDDMVRKYFAEYSDKALGRAPDPAAISDVVRYGALYLFGGVYLDMDTVAVRHLGSLVDAFSPFGVCEKPMAMPGLLRAEDCLYMNTAPIAAPAGHTSLLR